MNRATVIRAIEAFARSSNGPPQYTPEWYGIRKEKPYGKPRIGGSEVSTLLGMNPFETKEDLISFKETGNKEFKGNLACKFGTLFEDVAVRIFEIVNDVTVPCHGICLVDRGCNGLIFSPDGIGYMPVDRKGRIILPHDPQDRELFSPVIIEIKCPFRRVPTEEMPEHYVPQVQAGLIAVDIAIAGVFLDNLIRVCAFADLMTGEYNRRVHKDREWTYSQFESHGCLGIICCILKGRPSRNTPITYGGVYDLGDVGEKAFETNLDAMDKTTLRYFEPVEYPWMIMQDVDEWIDVHGGNGTMLGMVCWKHYGTQYTVMRRDKAMIENIYRAINDYLELPETSDTESSEDDSSDTDIDIAHDPPVVAPVKIPHSFLSALPPMRPEPGGDRVRSFGGSSPLTFGNSSPSDTPEQD